MEIVVDVGAVGVDLTLDLIAPTGQLTGLTRFFMIVGIVMTLARVRSGMAAHT